MEEYLPEGQHFHNIARLGPEIILITFDYFMSIKSISMTHKVSRNVLRNTDRAKTKIGAARFQIWLN